MVTPAITPLQFGVPGGMELAVILLIAVLLFGANKIPKLARSTGQAMGEFRRGREEIEQELEDMAGEGEEPAVEPDQATTAADDSAGDAESTEDEADEESK